MLENFLKESNQVYYAHDLVFAMNEKNISKLLANLKKNKLERIRICAHPSVDALIHEMIIILKNGAYVKPHKHLSKSESFHVIKGQGDIVLFNDDGTVQKIVSLGAYGSGRHFYYRLSAEIFHTIVVKSEYFIFHETTQGPFRPSETVYPAWA